MMVVYTLALVCLSVLPHYDFATAREKRDAAGALHILTNHAQPIHADVKPGGAGTDLADKPCPKNKSLSSHVENGVVFKVTAPEDTYYQKSLRKSLMQPPGRLELARSLGRGITLAALLVSAILEFYPLLFSIYRTIYSYLHL